MLFASMSSEIRCVFLFTSSDRIFERSKKIVWMAWLSQSLWIIFAFFGLLRSIVDE
jgi:hypothetical protein